MENLKSIPEYADVFTIEEFKDAVKSGLFTPYDGIGSFATTNGMQEESFRFVELNNPPDWATHIAWFNK